MCFVLIVMQIILASASPRRKELLSRVFPNFTVIPAVGEERADETASPRDYVRTLAEHKCREVFASHRDSLVIGCDTVVVFCDKIIGKPRDEQDAKSTLKALSGKTHLVMTGVCVCSPYRELSDVEVTEVRFNVLTDEFIESYVKSGSPLDKAGSYGIQDEGVVNSHYGSYTNVVGLPVTMVRRLAEEAMKI